MSAATELAFKLKSEGEKSVDFYGTLTDQQWNIEVYTEGSIWTIRDILAHLMTSERAFVRLFEEIRQGGAGASEDFEIERYNARQQEKTKDLTPHDLLEQYEAMRAAVVSWVSGLQDAELEMIGRHPFLGVTTMREMLKMIYIHNQTHFRDMKKVLK